MEEQCLGETVESRRGKFLLGFGWQSCTAYNMELDELGSIWSGKARLAPGERFEAIKTSIYPKKVVCNSDHEMCNHFKICPLRN